MQNEPLLTSPTKSCTIELCSCHGPLSCFGGSQTARCRLEVNKIEEDEKQVRSQDIPTAKES